MRSSSDPATLAALQTFVGTVRISAVEAIPFAVRYRRAPKFASGSVSSTDNVLVRVRTDAVSSVRLLEPRRRGAGRR